MLRLIPMNYSQQAVSTAGIPKQAHPQETWMPHRLRYSLRLLECPTDSWTSWHPMTPPNFTFFSSTFRWDLQPKLMTVSGSAPPPSLSIPYFYFVGMEFELRASCLLGRLSTTWAMLPTFFALVIFEIRSYVYVPAGLNGYPFMSAILMR
jgi:hypothetical protein